MDFSKKPISARILKSTSVKSYDYVLFEMRYKDCEHFGIHIGNGDIGDFAMLGSDEERASEFFSKAYTYELSPIHLQDFAKDCGYTGERLDFAKKCKDFLINTLLIRFFVI